jgi:hypothetical protein
LRGRASKKFGPTFFQTRMRVFLLIVCLVAICAVAEAARSRASSKASTLAEVSGREQN